MQPGVFVATALAQGAPLWAPRAGSRCGAMGPTHDHPEVARRVAAGTRVAVHTTPAFGGFWWQVQGGPLGGLLIRQHDPAWSVNGMSSSPPQPLAQSLPSNLAAQGMSAARYYAGTNWGGADVGPYYAMIDAAKATGGTPAQQGAVFDSLVRAQVQAAARADPGAYASASAAFRKLYGI